MKYSFLEKKIKEDDFWICWYALNARGWHPFCWGNIPEIVPISLYYGWYTKKDLVYVFFRFFFLNQKNENTEDPDFIYDCTVNLLDCMRPFNDIFSDGFLDLSWCETVNLARSVVHFSGKSNKGMGGMKKMTVLLMLFAVWPISLRGSYKEILRRLILIKSI